MGDPFWSHLLCILFNILRRALQYHQPEMLRSDGQGIMGCERRGCSCDKTVGMDPVQYSRVWAEIEHTACIDQALRRFFSGQIVHDASQRLRGKTRRWYFEFWCHMKARCCVL